LTGNVATESIYEDEGVKKIIENHFEVGRKFRELEFGAKLDKAMSAKIKGFEVMILQKDDKVFYQADNEIYL